MTTKRRGICPVCDREYDLTKAGVMRVHGQLGGWLMNCAGVGEPPKLNPPPSAVDALVVAAEVRGYRRAIQALREAGRDGTADYLDSLPAAASDREEAS